MPADLENAAVAIGKGQFSFQSQRKAMPKNVPTTSQLYSSHASKVKLKILQARLQQYVNLELPDVQAGLRKGRGTRAQIANIYWIIPGKLCLMAPLIYCPIFFFSSIRSTKDFASIRLELNI